MAIAVMVVIMALNILLLLAVMRIGTQEEHESEVAATDSPAVLAWRARAQSSRSATETSDA
ncbi:MAG: hypothetical protein OXI62_10180 [Chloroflexota bacterium]|nr:hypothetical protein [Chloroflexota bacterium]MCY3583098.1 hypothetical protein [Chloroflexota bacterium]MDE2651072.1 hypothetical protein [Chloroflexota bacterium]MXV93963.1 hypothetical protein [Chloroflexota bacterium]MXX83970.1 hypothetical protein [Chloroflexota bacterium]